MPKGNVAAPPEAPLDCPLCPRLFDFRTANAKAHPGLVQRACPVLRRHVRASSDRWPRAGPAGRQPHRPALHRRFRRRPSLFHARKVRLFAPVATRRGPTTAFTLKDAIISNAVRCVPPENKPTGAEILNCRQFLSARIAALPNVKVMLALGRIAHDSTVRALGGRPAASVFGHGRRHVLTGPHGKVALHDSYHCSRYNTNTGRLTEEMFHAVFAAIRKDLDG